MPAHHEHPATFAARQVALELEQIRTIESLVPLLTAVGTDRKGRRLVAQRIWANAHALWQSLEYDTSGHRK